MKKTSFTARILFSIMLFFLLSYLKYEKIISLEDWLITVFCISVSFFFGRILFLTTHIFLFILAVVDLHLKRTYQLSVFESAPWIFMFILDTNATEIQEYLPQISITEYVLLACVPLLSVLAWPYRPRWKISKLWYIVFWLTVPFSYLCHLYPTAAVFLSSDGKTVLNDHKNFKFNPSVSEKSARNVIVIIGESHRYNEFQEAFQKYKTDFKDLYGFDDMISRYPYTMRAVPMILSRKKLKDDTPYFAEKSLFSLFREAGYATYFLHYTTSSDLSEKNSLSFIYNEADHFINFESTKDNLHDINIRNELNKILTEDTQKKLIVIKMVGIHIGFQNRYPDEYDIRQPSLKKRLKEKTSWEKIRSKIFPNRILSEDKKEEALNTYKNAMDYSVEIIADLFNIAKKQPEPTLVMFSSDHGICIFEKGHLHIPANCREAFHIPVLFYLNPALRKNISSQKLENMSCNISSPLTQEYLFETIVSLANLSYPSADAAYNLTDKCLFSDEKRMVKTFPRDIPAFYEDL